MRILVFDDSPQNQQSARAQFKDHDLTVIGTFNEASDLLTPLVYGDQPNPKFRKFDVVLTDMMVPASDRSLGGSARNYAGQEMPLGSIIALQALYAGVKKVALVTDTNHHDHPASAALDSFQGGMEKPSLVGDASLYCTNYNVNGVFDAETFEQLEKDADHRSRKVVWAKDWAKALKTLLR